MKDADKTKEQLIKELVGLRERIAELEEPEAGRKRGKATRPASEEKYRVLVEIASHAITVARADTLLFVNPKTVEMTGYSQKELTSKPFADVIHPDDREMVLGRHLSTLEDEESPDVYAFRVVDKDGNIKWLEINATVIDWEGEPATLNLLTDITERKRAEEERKESFARLKRSLEATVSTLASAVETREAYAAGHQRLVTQLACAIATEMRLSEEQIDGIRLAALVHDVGKIYIPTEILSRPGKLSEIEYAMIKTHPQISYDVLKTIEFPGPVAETVLQHHERMDGSGYPQGLSDEEILLEARILGVADVVEAMASYRPYRPALSRDSALEEISQNKGTLYDPEVVEACLMVFYDKGFKFE